MAAAFASSLTTILRTHPSTTLLVPENKAFESLGLLMTYLLLPEAQSRTALQRVLKHHVLTSVAYTEELEGASAASYTTLEGSSVIISGGNVTSSGPWIADASLKTRNALTQTGVVHELRNGVLLPKSVKVNIGDLVHAAKGTTMASLIQRAGLGKLLNGTLTFKDVDDLDEWRRNHKPPHNSSLYKDVGFPKPGWTLLCPTDTAFKRVNLTALLQDIPALRRLVMQHIIPTPPSQSPTPLAHPLQLSDSATYTTLLSPHSLHGDIVLRATKDEEGLPAFLLGIRGARGTSGETDYARALAFGRTTTSDGKNGGRSGVIQIDTVLEPWVPGWWLAWGSNVAMGFVGGILILIFWAVVAWAWTRHDGEATYEPIGTDVAAEGTGEDSSEEA